MKSPPVRTLRALRLLPLTLFTLLLVATAAHAQSSQEVLVGHIDGIVNPVTSSYVDRVITEAEHSHAQAVVFYTDTPGGLSEAVRDVNLRIERASVPVLVYVAPNGARAGAAGVYIAYAAHLVGMAPVTTIGSATPIAEPSSGSDAGIQTLAAQRGRDAAFAARAVREGADLQAPEALQANVVNFIATDLADFLNQADGATVQLPAGSATLHTANAPTRSADMSALESFLQIITNPTIAYILLSMGSLALMLELYHPGAIFPGVIGGIALLLAFYALGTLPLNFTGLALIAFGLLLFGLEPFLTSHGLLTVGGAAAFVLGSILLINIPDAPYLEVSRWAIIAVTAVISTFFLVLVGAVLRSRRGRVITGREGLLGASGVVRRDIEPGRAGMVLVHGELWRARAAQGRLIVNEQVIVESVDGLVLTVRRASALAPAPARPAAPASAKSNIARV